LCIIINALNKAEDTYLVEWFFSDTTLKHFSCFFSWLIDDSNNYVAYCYVCRKAGPDIAGKNEFVTGKKLKRESPVYHNKTKSLKHEKCFNRPVS
jgi:hypothetical protein